MWLATPAAYKIPAMIPRRPRTARIRTKSRRTGETPDAATEVISDHPILVAARRLPGGHYRAYLDERRKCSASYSRSGRHVRSLPAEASRGPDWTAVTGHDGAWPGTISRPRPGDSAGPRW